MLLFPRKDLAFNSARTSTLYFEHSIIPGVVTCSYESSVWMGVQDAVG